MTIPPLRHAAPSDLTEAQFRHVGDLVTSISGIQLPTGKQSLVRSRLLKRLRALGIFSIQEYLDRMAADRTRAELAEMVDVLTTNKTSFFRELEHFRLLRETVLPQLAAHGGPMRIWSAGCSSGEEPYSIAITARESLGPAAPRLRVLATDLSARMLRLSSDAEYGAAAIAQVPAALRAAHFVSVPERTDVRRVAAPTRELVRFARLNLMDAWPMRGPFDVIFCRNVMIYFDKKTQERLVARFAELLAPGGYLCVGHSESLSGLRHQLTYVQPATFRNSRDAVD
ncbi:MAG: CheR family methyltransferase [Gemmatimonadaceae bacterium]